MRYVVAHWTRGVDDSGPKSTKQYLTAINYNPYNKPRQELSTVYTGDMYQAFVFTDVGAAEMAAVFVGGQVERLDN
jgi:hypothetical protein